ncbi:energy transducer TonB [Olleya sp. YSTF-M6]|uniref:Energy transducer TonB n=1 Tax=Olleya sediminilitoris TaxID=2795739 RepID=A0ABS1WNA7_9FLAO|nr:energy transducer TonB [Olleya sediminilitoris]MBL7560593.1 energy transducer TonB [Olleya sediminilitoris]
MANYYSIKIPKPCHENWDTMSPQDKGRFCGSCNKTVIDFTKMDTYQIQDFLQENKDKRICGHIKQTQLDSINLTIPLSLIQQKHSVYKSFFLAAMIIMGTTLFNCSSKNGTPKKIDTIEVIDSTKNEVIDVLGLIKMPIETDSLITKQKNCKAPQIIKAPIPPVDGILIVENVTTGEIMMDPDPVKIEPPIIDIMGDVEFIEYPTTEPFSIYNVETLPKFQNTTQNLSKNEELNYFESQLSTFTKANFTKDSAINLELKGKQRVFINFKIENNGSIKILNIRAPHPSLKKEAERVMKKLPKFIPAKKDGKNVSVLYTLPIIFNTED